MKRSGIIILLGLALIVVVAIIMLNRSAAPATQSTETPRPSFGLNAATSPPSEFSPQVLDEIDQQVHELRGLDALRPVSRTLQTRAELEQSMIRLQSESLTPEDARNNVLALAALGLVEPDLNLYDLYIDLLTEQVLGFYDPDSQALYVVSDAESFGALEKVAYAHEYDHALQDQNFDLTAMGFSNQSEQSLESDVLLARQALIEGDATFLMQLWSAEHLSQAELLSMLDQATTLDTAVLDSLPPIFRKALEFPYFSGLSFVTLLYSDGGWEAVNAAFRNPPSSSEQILHPEKYPDDQPIAVSLPPLTDTLGANWRLAEEDVLGELYLRETLREHLTENVFPASSGWGGDRYAVYVTQDTFDDPARAPEYVLVMSHVWDSAQDGEEFAAAYAEYTRTRFNLGDPTRSDSAAQWWVGTPTTFLWREGDRTWVVLAPDEAIAQRVVDAIEP